MRRNHMQSSDLCLNKAVCHIDLTDHYFIECPLLIVFRGEVQAGCRICLRVSIYNEDFLLKY